MTTNEQRVIREVSHDLCMLRQAIRDGRECAGVYKYVLDSSADRLDDLLKETGGES